MRLQAEDLLAISGQLEKSLPGIGEAFAKDATEVPLSAVPRASLLQVLQAAGDAATVVMAPKMITPSINVLLRDIEPGKSSEEVIDTLQKAFHEQFVLPAKGNASKMMIVAHAILDHVRKTLRL